MDKPIVLTLTHIIPAKELVAKYVQNILELNGWNKAATARQLKMTRRSLYNMIRDGRIKLPPEEAIISEVGGGFKDTPRKIIRRCGRKSGRRHTKEHMSKLGKLSAEARKAKGV